ncbi:hypothetical protein CN916_30905 [Bacillus thuringiensis]|nr:hypothetical protein COM85_08650 [Bacillus thuringiensis]PFE55642.1 hypothetical protein CN312_00650 [Bacillus thuringiensis]PFT97259.1 hypothetical protein COK78_23645 [Bacillus thuringiensis]PGL15958.1 hypothetical protein CN916_30905 [Bacillus thuringiensis]PGO39051.1 hypothetical protein CN979_17160 [Bacillus thuringiensis]
MKIMNIVIFITYTYYFILLLTIIQMIIHSLSVRILYSSLFTYTYNFYNLLVNRYSLIIYYLTLKLLL